MCYTKIPKNTGILFSKIPVSVFESNPGIPVFSGIPQGPDWERAHPAKDAAVEVERELAGFAIVKKFAIQCSQWGGDGGDGLSRGMHLCGRASGGS